MKTKNKTNDSKVASIDVVYQEMYQEMRRFRDYELTVATWYTSILLAILGFTISILYGSTPEISTTIQNNLFGRWLVALLSMLIGLGCIFSIRYVSSRNKQLRDFTDNLEPKKAGIPEGVLEPKDFIVATLAVLTAIISLLLIGLAGGIIFLFTLIIVCALDIFPSENRPPV